MTGGTYRQLLAVIGSAKDEEVAVMCSGAQMAVVEAAHNMGQAAIVAVVHGQAEGLAEVAHCMHSHSACRAIEVIVMSCATDTHEPNRLQRQGASAAWTCFPP
jgi:hypothetical protein